MVFIQQWLSICDFSKKTRFVEWMTSRCPVCRLSHVESKYLASPQVLQKKIKIIYNFSSFSQLYTFWCTVFIYVYAPGKPLPDFKIQDAYLRAPWSFKSKFRFQATVKACNLINLELKFQLMSTKGQHQNKKLRKKMIRNSKRKPI